jgi:hypothetical protein
MGWGRSFGHILSPRRSQTVRVSSSRTMREACRCKRAVGMPCRSHTSTSDSRPLSLSLHLNSMGTRDAPAEAHGQRDEKPPTSSGPLIRGGLARENLSTDPQALATVSNPPLTNGSRSTGSLFNVIKSSCIIVCPTPEVEKRPLFPMEADQHIVFLTPWKTQV